MNTLAVIGLLWGDEGKGKIVDLLSEDADVVVRYQGGTNAGHTVFYKGKPLSLHLIPSGIFNDKTICVIGNGCVVDFTELYEEILLLEKEGVDIRGRLFISERAHITFPFHIEIDKRMESAMGSSRIGTTFRGVGPTYTDKYARTGVRIVDLFYPEELKKLLELNLKTKKDMCKEINVASLVSDFLTIADKVKGFVIDTVSFLNEEIDNGKRVLFEGAQGNLLDVDLGTYPYVTSSHPTVGGICSGAGVSASRLKRVIGVSKAYATRVGQGAFPTEFEEDFEEDFRKDAKEFGSTTGRPRKCGWFDAVAVKYGCIVNGVNSIALTKLDCLSGLKKIKVCVDYKSPDGKKLSSFPADTRILSRVKPVYVEMEGWTEEIRGIKKIEALPRKTIDYIKALKKILNVDIVIISTGPEREETIVRKKIW